MNEGFADFYYDATDGLRLHARIYGERRDSHPVVCLAGLTRNARDFHEIALLLSKSTSIPRQVVAFDYRGRGQSAHEGDWQKYTVATELGDILHGLAILGISRAHFIGTSRGGLILQIMAAFRPDLIVSAVLNDIGPVVEREGLAAIRGYLSGATQPASRDEAIARQKLVHGPAFPALADEDWARMVDAIYRFEGTRPVLDFDPALVNALTAGDPDAPLPQLWKEFTALASRRVLAIRGANSLLLSAATLDAMATVSVTVETITVAGQGHAPFLETGRLPARIASFLGRCERDGFRKGDRQLPGFV